MGFGIRDLGFLTLAFEGEIDRKRAEHEQQAEGNLAGLVDGDEPRVLAGPQQPGFTSTVHLSPNCMMATDSPSMETNTSR